MNNRSLLFVSGSLLKATSMQKFLHLGVSFMLNIGLLQYGIFSGDPLLDESVFLVAIVVALLARRLVEFFLNIGIRFGFGSFGIRLGMAGPVIATGVEEPGGERPSSSSSDSRRGIGNRM